MENVELKIDGMTCSGCVNSIQNALYRQDGVNKAVADIDNSSVTVEFDPAVIKREGLVQAIADAGFDVLT
jgi:copper chaperone